MELKLNLINIIQLKHNIHFYILCFNLYIKIYKYKKWLNYSSLLKTHLMLGSVSLTSLWEAFQMEVNQVIGAVGWLFKFQVIKTAGRLWRLRWGVGGNRSTPTHHPAGWTVLATRRIDFAQFVYFTSSHEEGRYRGEEDMRTLARRTNKRILYSKALSNWLSLDSNYVTRWRW